MKCPHCLVAVHKNWNESFIAKDSESGWGFMWQECPNCHRLIINLIGGSWHRTQRGMSVDQVTVSRLVHPVAANRPPAPREVPNEFGRDYEEACMVYASSPKACAALGRRCLQHILREKAGVAKSELSREIQEVLDSKVLPSYLANSLDAVRNIGNFAAHPMKSTSSGQIVEVEPAEAEWTLDVIESLFDFFFVQPEILRQKREALDKKLSDLGKPKLKAEK